LTEAGGELIKAVDTFCHERGIRFIFADVRGLFARGFCDFGENHEIHDKNGETYEPVFLSSIQSQDGETVVKTLEHHFHGLEEGDTVSFTEIEGMTQLNFDQNGGKIYKVKR